MCAFEHVPSGFCCRIHKSGIVVEALHSGIIKRGAQVHTAAYYIYTNTKHGE